MYGDILRMLVIQAGQMNPSAISSSIPITAVHLREASNYADWLNILRQILTGIAQVYVVLDAIYCLSCPITAHIGRRE
jgi:hypothetical protein